MTEERLKEIIVKISKMNNQELQKYGQEVYMSKEDLGAKAFKIIQKALDIQAMNLRDVTSLSPMAVCAEIEED